MCVVRAAFLVIAAALLAAVPADAAEFRGGVTVGTGGFRGGFHAGGHAPRFGGGFHSGVHAQRLGGGFHSGVHAPRFGGGFHGGSQPQTFLDGPARIGPPNLSPQARASSGFSTGRGAVVLAPGHRLGFGRPVIVAAAPVLIPRPVLVPPSRTLVVRPRPVPVVVPRRPVLIVDTDGFFLRVGGD